MIVIVDTRNHFNSYVSAPSRLESITGTATAAEEVHNSDA
jgi:hypothetical protein